MIHNGWLTVGETIVNYMKRKVEFEWRRREPKFISTRYFTQPAMRFVRKSGTVASPAFRFVRRKAKK